MDIEEDKIYDQLQHRLSHYLLLKFCQEYDKLTQLIFLFSSSFILLSFQFIFKFLYQLQYSTP